MCGIVAIFASTLGDSELRKEILDAGKRLRHRGPDWSGVKLLSNESHGGIAIEHERLAIIDPESGAQPLVSADGNITLAVNGEIYNYRELQAQLPVDYTFQTKSDCEIIIPLYLAYGVEGIKLLRGMFSFVLYDSNKKQLLAARDHLGITPFYFGYGADGSIWFASELKALEHGCVRFEHFPPGQYFLATLTSGETFGRWYSPRWLEPGHVATDVLSLEKLRMGFEAAVHRRMMADVPWGVLLSGGLDSSLVAAIAAREQRKQQASATSNQSLLAKLHSFTIGLANSPDLVAAQEVADFLKTEHHAFTYTIQEGLDAVADVIYHLETYDVTTIRASTPMFLMSRKIKAMGIKMVLSGEGADEIFGGYLYFHKAPSAQAFHQETIDKLKGLYQFDCLRANKSTSAWGLEARVPFLDADFLDLAMNIQVGHKMCVRSNDPLDDDVHRTMEKYIVRKAFDTPEDPYLPDSILWRQKEQFSDGVGYGWIDGLKDWAEKEVSDRQMNQAALLFPYNTPLTKEAYLYRKIFTSHFEKEVAAMTVPGGKSIACSTAAAVEWDIAFQQCIDPSGRAIAGIHVDAYDDDDDDDDDAQGDNSGVSKKPKLL